MKNKHVKSFNELNENKNLNISDVITQFPDLIQKMEDWLDRLTESYNPKQQPVFDEMEDFLNKLKGN